MTQDILIKEFTSLPEHLKQEVLDFLLFLKEKQKKQQQAVGKPKFGAGKYKGKLAPDFDAPLEDFKDYM